PVPGASGFTDSAGAWTAGQVERAGVRNGCSQKMTNAKWVRGAEQWADRQRVAVRARQGVWRCCQICANSFWASRRFGAFSCWRTRLIIPVDINPRDAIMSAGTKSNTQKGVK